MARLALFLLGRFDATLDSQTVTAFKTDKVRALLAYLAVENDRAHRRDALATLLWPDGSDEAARANLRQSLCRLRDALRENEQATPLLLATTETIQLNPAGDYWVDVLEFNRLLAACHAHRHRSLEGCSSCAGRLAQAAALVGGEFLAGLSLKDSPGFADWSLVRQEAMHRAAMEALQHLAAHYQQAGNATDAEFYLQRQAAMEPWCEPAHQQLMRLYAASGRRSLAAVQYVQCRRALMEQLGIAPERATTALFEAIRSGQPNALPQRGRLVNAPQQPASLVGREQEIALIGDTLENPDCRVLTLVGLGGCGKTSLALHAAAEHAPAFRDGACFCSFDLLGAADPPASTLAQALGLDYSGAQDAQSRVRQFLRDREMLLVFDNLERLPDTNWVAQLLRDAPQIVILAASLHRLDIHGEWCIEVHGLAYPEPDRAISSLDALRYPAVRLFVLRAAQAQAGFSLTEENALHVARICRQVEGLPLALELAASWTGLLSCAEIADAIDTSPDFLATAWRDLPGRQRSMRATFDHSWSLLSPQEQAAFACLSVFRGEFGHAAARAVVGNPCTAHCRHGVDEDRPVLGAGCLFRRLVEKALLGKTSPGRFRLHSLLRQFAEEKLALDAYAQKTACQRYADYYAALSDRALVGWDGPQGEAWRARLQQEQHNLETALAWALSDGKKTPETIACLRSACQHVRR
ncbi:MAG: BTAD domain-containing putative transcriptional regulator [Chloroflexota bacterium]|nr:BTAD domain-containing putative transcriptional regulator [Chloroflexota bacterium]